MIGYNWVKITDVYLEGLLLLVVRIPSSVASGTSSTVAHIMVWGTIVIWMILAHVVVTHAISLEPSLGHWIVAVIGSGNAASMGSPVQFKVPVILAGNLFPVECGEHVSGRLEVLEFYKTIADRLVGDLVLDELDVGDDGDLVELHCDVLFVHPWQDIADPERLSLLRLLLLLLRLLHGRALHLRRCGSGRDRILVVWAYFLIHVWLLHFYVFYFKAKILNLNVNKL